MKPQYSVQWESYSCNQVSRVLWLILEVRKLPARIFVQTHFCRLLLSQNVITYHIILEVNDSFHLSD